MTTSPRPRPWVAPGPPSEGGGREPRDTRPRPVTAPAVTIGDYTLLAKIGEGGMGIVHLARRRDGERVALKVLRPHIVGDDEARRRLAREVSSLRLVRSRWVAEIVDADPWAPVPYVATRYVPGLSLHDHVVEEGPVTGRDLLWLASCLAEGVASVHTAGVLHRDVKPSNVLMEGRTPILIDFGLARVADDPRLTHTGWLIGTPGYLAPEILYGDDATTASDVHSWAATVAYAATGRAPFGRGPSMAIMDRVRRGEHDLTGVPGGLRALLTDALEPEPARRPSLDQVRARVRDLSEGRGADDTHTDRIPVLAPPARPTMPYGHVAAEAAERPTDVWSDATEVSPEPPPATLVLAQHAPPAPAPAPLLRPVPPGATRAELSPKAEDREPLGWPGEWVEPGAPEPRPRFAERVRRALLLLLLAADLGLATAAYPWLTLGVLLVAVWLVRSGSLATSAAGDRRRVRGRRWYDAALLLVRAPWDLVRSLPGTIVLVLWSGGLAVSAALLCYAAAASLPVALGVVGSAFALSLWTGPGGSRVRSPVGRVVRPAARTWQAWLVSLVVLAGVGLGLAALLGEQGPTWAPADDQPLGGRPAASLLDPFARR